MCTTCGCGQGELTLDGHQHAHDHDGHDHHHHGPAITPGPSYGHSPGWTPARMVKVEQDLLAKNNAYAAANRRYFAERGIFALNLVSSPGAGKTTLLTKTISAWKARAHVAVIEGDQQSTRDADRIRATGVPAVQVNTGKGCHLDAHMVGHAMERLALPQDAVLFIENVGNLVCPAAFDLGEAHKVVVLSVTEGDDKPLKYPDMFYAAHLMLLNKVDLLPYVEFDVDQCIAYARRVNRDIDVLQVSATRGDGIDAWHAWLEGGWRSACKARQQAIGALSRGNAELDAKAGPLRELSSQRG